MLAFLFASLSLCACSGGGLFSVGAGAGSGFQHFPTLDAALEASATYSEVTIVLQDSQHSLQSAVLITSTVAVDAQGATISVAGTVTVQSGGNFTLQRAVVQQVEAQTPLFSVNIGRIGILGSAFGPGSRQVVEVLSGALSLGNSSFQGLQSAVVVLRSTAVSLSVDHSQFSHCADLVEVNSQSTSSSGTISVHHLELTGIGRLVNVRHSELGSFRAVFDEITVKTTQFELITGSFDNVHLTVQNSTFFDAQGIISGSLNESYVTLYNCSFTRIRNRLFDLSAMRGEIALVFCTISEVWKGPIALLPSNPFPYTSAKIEFVGCLIENVTNDEGKGALFGGSAVSLTVDQTEVRESRVWEGGLFTIISGSATISDLFYHDSDGFLGTFYESTGSQVAVVDSALTRLSQDPGYYSSCVASSWCLWRNVSITDCWDPNPPTFFVFIWSGYLAVALIERSYFRNEGGVSVLTMGATDEGELRIADSVFEGLRNVETFGAFTGGRVEVRNVTLIRPQLEILFSCVFTTQCLDATDIQVEGNSSIGTIINSNGGFSQLSNAAFSSLSGIAIKVTNANITLCNVTITGLADFLCKNCINSHIFLSNVSLTDVRTATVFQLSYSSSVWRNVYVRNGSVEHVLVVDNSELRVEGGCFRGLTVDSFGGLISAISSSVTVDSVVIRHVPSYLSIYQGLISLEFSSLDLRNSDCSDFDYALIRAEAAPHITISHSKFYANKHTFQENHRVTHRGSVLWSDSAISISVEHCRFYNLSADFGGVMFVTGGGTETFAVFNCSAVGNTAYGTGGFLHADNVLVTISHSDFSGNFAESGGALAIQGCHGAQCVSISDSQFAHNTAVLNGGAVLHVHSRASVSSCQWTNNAAQYGPNIASEVSVLSVLDGANRRLPNYTIDCASGQLYTTLIVVGCLDYLDQTVSTADEWRLTLYTTEPQAEVTVSTLLESVHGLIAIPGVTIVGAPDSQLVVYGALGTGLTQALFRVRLRACLPGEHQVSTQCRLCTHNTYSLRPTQPCTLCPQSADCLVGAELSLHAGYWRSDNMTDDIYECVVPQACVGGLNSECSEGYTGPLCLDCAGGFFKASQLQCVACQSRGLALFKSIVALSLSLTAAVFTALFPIKYEMVYLVALDYLQSLYLLANYRLHWPRALAQFYVLVGDVGSGGLTTLTSQCIGVLTSSPSYSPLALTAVSTTALFAVVAVTWGLRAIKRSRARSDFFPRLLAYLALQTFPILWLRAAQMFPCVRVGAADCLLYSSTVTCWSRYHLRFTLALAVPLLLLGMVGFSALLIASVGGRKWVRGLQGPKCVYLAAFLLRKYALALLLAFSHMMALCTQASFAITVNILTELAISTIKDCRETVFFRLYGWTLSMATLHSYSTVIYSSATAASRHVLFTIVSYLCAFAPVVFYCVIVHAGSRRAAIVPLSARVGREEPQEESQNVSSVQDIALFAPCSTPKEES